MKQTDFILCPICNSKTRIKIRSDTVLENFTLFCPKCKQETLINVKQLNMSVIKEPDAKKRADNTQILVCGYRLFSLTTTFCLYDCWQITAYKPLLSANWGYSLSGGFEITIKAAFFLLKNGNTEGVLKSPIFKDMAVSRRNRHVHFCLYYPAK